MDRSLFSEKPVPRKEADYDSLKHKAAARLSATIEQVGRLVGDTLQQYHQVSLLIDQIRSAKSGVGAIGAALSDVHDQLAFLLPRHFLLHTQYDWLEHFPRYLAGMRLRLKNLMGGGVSILNRDLDAMAAIHPWWNNYLQRRDQHLALNFNDPPLTLFRWMLEEYRISLFAQELGAVIPISERRLEKQWEKVRK